MWLTIFVFCMQFNVTFIYHSIMELQELTKIKVLLPSNVLVDLDLLAHPQLRVGRMGHGAHHLPLVQVSVMFNH